MLRLGLEAGYASTADAVAWADRVIAGTDPCLIAEMFEPARIPAHASEAEARDELRAYLLAHAL